jgi:hypothetical protein
MNCNISKNICIFETLLTSSMVRALRTRKIAPYLAIALSYHPLFIFGYPYHRSLFSFQRIQGISGGFIGIANYKHVLQHRIQAAVETTCSL